MSAEWCEEALKMNNECTRGIRSHRSTREWMSSDMHYHSFRQSISRRPRESMFTSSLCALVEANSSVCCRTWQRKIPIELISIKLRENWTLNLKKIANINCRNILIITLPSSYKKRTINVSVIIIDKSNYSMKKHSITTFLYSLSAIN